MYTVGPSWLSCIQWNLSIEDTIGTQLAVLYTVEPLYRGHHWDPAGCPVYSVTSYREHQWDPAGCPVWRGVPNSEVDLYTVLYTYVVSNADSAFIREVSFIQRVLCTEVPLHAQ